MADTEVSQVAHCTSGVTGRRKLRESCDECATSKIKCTREKPVCARCCRRGLACQYMASRRAGRASASARVRPDATGQPTPASTGHCRDASTASAVSTGGPSHATCMVSSPATPPRATTTGTLPVVVSEPSFPESIPTNQGTRPQEHGQPSPDMDIWRSIDILSPNALLDDSLNAISPLATLEIDFGDQFDPALATPMLIDVPTIPQQEPASATSGQCAQSAPDSTFDPIRNLSLSGQCGFPNDISALDSAAACPASSSSCLAATLKLLMQLFPNASTVCKLPATGMEPASDNLKLPTIDCVIANNKQIIESVTTVLNCPCSQDEYIVTIVTLIVLKMMAWYAAVVVDSTPPDGDAMNWTLSSSSSNSVYSMAAALTPSTEGLGQFSTGQNSPAIGEKVFRRPTVIGNYRITGNDSDQGRMAAQLVLSELHRVQRLVDALSKRLESVRSRVATGDHRHSAASLGSSSGGDDLLGEASLPRTRTPPLSVPMFHQLGEDLRKRLRSLSSETIDILRQA